MPISEAQHDELETIVKKIELLVLASQPGSDAPPASPTPFVPNTLQAAILEALNGKA